MKRKLCKVLIDEIYKKPAHRNYTSNKLIFKSLDDTWSLDVSDLNNYGSQNNRSHRYILVVTDNFIKFGWTVPLENKNTLGIINSFEDILKSSKRKPNFTETDDGSDFVNNLFFNLLKTKKLKVIQDIHHQELFLLNLSIEVLKIYPKKYFHRGDAIWVNVSPTTTTQYDKRTHSTTELAPIDACKKSNEKVLLNSV